MVVPKLLAMTREQRRRQLIDGAWRCLSRRSYGDLTVDDICAEAGLSKGSFYAHYPSKESLLVALIADDAASVAEVAADPDTLRLGPVQRIRRLTATMLMQGADPARVQLRSDAWGSAQTYSAVRAAVASAVSQRQRVLRAWVEEGVTSGELVIDLPPNALAALLLAISDGLILHYGLDPHAFRWGKLSKAVDGILEGFATIRRPQLRVL